MGCLLSLSLVGASPRRGDIHLKNFGKVDTTPSDDYLSGGEAVIDVIKGMLSSFFR